MLKKLLAPLALTITLAATLAGSALAAVVPDVLVRDLSVKIIDAVKADPAIQAGDVKKVIALVDEQVLPYLNFQRMTASAVGVHWRGATPEQKQKLQNEFKLMLVRTYAGALAQVKDQSVERRPFRGSADDPEVVIRTQVKGSGEPIQLDYRLEKAGDSWKIFDVNVLGIWVVSQYRNSFSQEINAGGLDGLIAKLAERNQAAGK